MTLFRRVFLSHLLVAVIALLVSTTAIGYLVYQSTGHSRALRLEAYGEQIAERIRDRTWDEESLPLIAPLSEVLAKSESTQVWLVDRAHLEAYVLAPNPVLLQAGLDPADFSALLAGRKIEQSTWEHPLSIKTSVGIPVLADGSVSGAIIMSPSTANNHNVQIEILGFLVGGSAFSVIFATMVSFGLSRRIARPISAINAAATQVSHGDLSVRVQRQSTQEIQQLAMSFNQMADELERLERARKDLIANVSHELKGPLARVTSFVEAIHDGIGGPMATARYMDIMRGELQRLGQLVNDLLDFARMETDSYKLHLLPFDLVPHLRRTTAVFEMAASAAGVRLLIDIPAVLPIVACDIGRVERIVVNLLQNALAHTPAGGAISVTARAGRGFVEIEVIDTGRGIPVDQLDRVWERFYKVDRVRTPDPRGGSGLGLAIVKRLVELHDGAVFVESWAGVGSRFGFRLPITTEESQSA